MSRRIILFFSLILISFSCFADENLFQQARALQHAGEYDEAIEAYKTILLQPIDEKRLLLRKGNHSKFKHLIFSLHYTALLELLIIFLYLIHLIASPPSWIMQTLLISVSFTYLTFAVRKTYQISRWYKAVNLAIFTNLGYSLILMAIFIIILLISTTIVAIQMT
jgi:tetratricopeptide (TPR) repeat protein